MVATEDEKLAQTPVTEGLQTIEDELTMPVHIKKHIRRHNKPKKAQDYVVSPQGTEQNLQCPCTATLLFLCSLSLNVIMAIVTDYACTGDDWSVIEKIRSEPSKERNLVSIGDAFLKKRHLLSLLSPEEWVGDEVSILGQEDAI